MITLGGNVVIRNGDELDFCWRESIQSLLPVCDKVLVCDGESTDGTWEELCAWRDREPKLVLCRYPWPNPKGDWEFFFKWINYARQHVPCDYQFQMDADEVLSERSYAEVDSYKNRMQSGERFSVVCHRYNFWQDTTHIIPHGVCLGHRVIRIAPTNMPLASDGDHPEGREAPKIARDSNIEIFHYGFLRDRERFFKKERLLQDMFFASWDPRLEQAAKFDGNWMKSPGVTGWENNLMECHSPHPRVALRWLQERNHAVS